MSALMRDVAGDLHYQVVVDEGTTDEVRLYCWNLAHARKEASFWSGQVTIYQVIPVKEGA